MGKSQKTCLSCNNPVKPTDDYCYLHAGKRVETPKRDVPKVAAAAEPEEYSFDRGDMTDDEVIANLFDPDAAPELAAVMGTDVPKLRSLMNLTRRHYTEDIQEPEPDSTYSRYLRAFVQRDDVVEFLADYHGMPEGEVRDFLALAGERLAPPPKMTEEEAEELLREVAELSKVVAAGDEAQSRIDAIKAEFRRAEHFGTGESEFGDFSVKRTERYSFDPELAAQTLTPGELASITVPRINPSRAMEVLSPEQLERISDRVIDATVAKAVLTPEKYESARVRTTTAISFG